VSTSPTYLNWQQFLQKFLSEFSCDFLIMKIDYGGNAFSNLAEVQSYPPPNDLIQPIGDQINFFCLQKINPS